MAHQSLSEYEQSVLADVAACVRRAADPKRAAAIDSAVSAAVVREFPKAIALYGMPGAVEILERLLAGNPGHKCSVEFVSAVRVEFGIARIREAA